MYLDTRGTVWIAREHQNTTLRELTLEVARDTSLSPMLTSLRDHLRLRRLCLHGNPGDLTGLETLLLSETSKITELDIHGVYTCPPGLTRVLQALKRYPTLTMLNLRWFLLGRHESRLLQIALCNTPSLQSLDLASMKVDMWHSRLLYSSSCCFSEGTTGAEDDS
jgi:hypothetical protein